MLRKNEEEIKILVLTFVEKSMLIRIKNERISFKTLRRIDFGGFLIKMFLIKKLLN